MPSRTKLKFNKRQVLEYWIKRLPIPPVFFDKRPEMKKNARWDVDPYKTNSLYHNIALGVTLLFDIVNLLYTIECRDPRTYTQIERLKYGPFSDMDTAITYFKLHLQD